MTLLSDARPAVLEMCACDNRLQLVHTRGDTFYGAVTSRAADQCIQALFLMVSVRFRSFGMLLHRPHHLPICKSTFAPHHRVTAHAVTYMLYVTNWHPGATWMAALVCILVGWSASVQPCPPPVVARGAAPGQPRTDKGVPPTVTHPRQSRPQTPPGRAWS